MWKEPLRLILAFAIVLTAGAGPALAQGATVEFVALDTETQGNWKDVYGTDGFHIILDTEAYPSYAEVAFTNASTWTWVASTTDVRGLETAAGGDRLATCWFQNTPWQIDINLTDGRKHQVAVYFLDWDSTVRATTVEVLDAATNEVLDSQEMLDYNAGKWLVWEIKGHVVINVVHVGGANSVASGVFFDKPFNLGGSSDPVPLDTAIDIPRDTALGWSAGEFAATHDVYFGTVFDDVNDASRTDPMGVLLSQGQTETTYTPENVLEFGQTYYWRVDEVNAAPDNTIYKGETWSFTVEPVAYPIEGVIASSNADYQPGAGPENTVNGSGLNADDQHSTESEDMFLGTPGAEPIALQYEFDGVYKLHEMLVWNYNVQFEILLGFGIKNVTAEYSVDGVEWTVLSDVELAQATASADYTANSTISFGGVPAKFVKLTVNSGFGMMGQFGLSEVRFLFIPAQAREPEPGDGAADVSVDTALNWRAGREAVSHEVHFGTDAEALEMLDTTSIASAAPGALDLGMDYFWKVDEVNEADAVATWEGPVWSFTTQAYLVVDDFESYDDEENRIYQSWIDGYGVNTNGSTVGHLESPFAEQTIVRSGAQSMPLFYDNSGAAMSEAEFALNQNWTANGIKSLSLMFAGAADNTGGQLYIKVNGTKVLYDGAAEDLNASGWLAWTINTSALGNVSNVTTLTIGVEGAGASGVVYVDDIRLYPQEAMTIEPVEPDAANLVLHYPLDSDFQDASGNGNHGQAVGDATIANDPVLGSVASFDGMGDGILVPAIGDGTASETTLSLWVNTDVAWTSGFLSVYHNDGWEPGDLHIHISNGGYFTSGINGLAGGDVRSLTMPEVDQWYHVVVTATGAEANLYINGILETTRVPTAAPETLNMGEGHLGIWLDGGGNQQRALTGQIDEVRFYDRALTHAEVLSLAGRTMPIYQTP